MKDKDPEAHSAEDASHTQNDDAQAGEKADKESDKDSDNDSDNKSDKPSDDGGQKKNAPRNKMPLIILGVIVLLGAIAAFIWWFATRNQVTTDDAYVDGNAVTMSPNVSGYVTALLINDNSYVHKGDLLVQIDARNYEATRDSAAAQLAMAWAQLESAKIALRLAGVQYPAQLAQAQAQEKSARASFVQAKSSYDRQHAVDRRATTEENIDAADSQHLAAQASVDSARAQVRIASQVSEQLAQAKNKVAQAESQVKEAQAQLAAANLNVEYCRIVAPSDGWIAKRNVQQGSFLAAGTPMFILVTPEIWVTANFKESQLERMQPGDEVDIGVDAYPGRKLHGHVDSIQLGSGSRFAAFPTENATGNFVKIVQRIPVKIVVDRGFDPKEPLPLGLSVSPVVMLK